MTKSHAPNVELPVFDYEAATAQQAEAERIRLERAPAVEAAAKMEATIRERVAVLRAGREPRPTVTGGQWGEFMACLVNAGSFAGQASTAAANGDNAHSLDCFANAFGALAEAEAML